MRSVLSRCSLVAMVAFFLVVCLMVGSASAGPNAIIKKFPSGSSQLAVQPKLPGQGVTLKAIPVSQKPPGPPAGLKLPSQADWIMGYTRAGINAYRSVKGMRNGPPRRGTPRGKYPAYPGRPRPHYPPYDPHRPWTPDPHAWDHRDPGSPPPASEAPPENPWPLAADRPGVIEKIDPSFDPAKASAIVNPQETGVVLRYLLNGKEIELPPGHYQNLGFGRTWTVEFDRGGSQGKHRYSIGNGLFEFTPTPDGWELFHKKPN